MVTRDVRMPVVLGGVIAIVAGLVAKDDRRHVRYAIGFILGVVARQLALWIALSMWAQNYVLAYRIYDTPVLGPATRYFVYFPERQRMEDGVVKAARLAKVIGEDPFGEKGWNDYDERIYSVGPDLTDQFGRVIYDPTNGTFSTGDIMYEGPRRGESPASPDPLLDANPDSSATDFDSFPFGSADPPKDFDFDPFTPGIQDAHGKTKGRSRQ